MTRHFFNNLLSLNVPRLRYLEVGTFLGSSLISATFGNFNVEALCIDNWSERFKNGDARLHFYENLWNNLGGSAARVTVLNDDCFRPGLLDGQEPFDIFFFDGPHQKEDLRHSVVAFEPYLAEVSIFIVSDWNSFEVRDGALQGFAELSGRVVIRNKYVVNYSSDGSLSAPIHSPHIFDNGIAVFVLQKLAQPVFASPKTT